MIVDRILWAAVGSLSGRDGSAVRGGHGMTTVPVQEPPLTRSDLRDELDRTLKHYATKADVANLKVWIVGLLLVVVLNVVGTAGAIVAALLAR